MRLKWIIWLTPAVLLLAGCSSQVRTAGSARSYSSVVYYDYYYNPFYDCYPSAVWYPYYSMYWNSFGDPYCYGFYSGPVYSWSYYHRYPYYRYSGTHYRNWHVTDSHSDRYPDRYYRRDRERDHERPIQPIQRRPGEQQATPPIRATRTARPQLASDRTTTTGRLQRERPQQAVSQTRERSTTRPSSPPPAPRPSPPPARESRSSNSYSPPVASSSSSSGSYSAPRSSSQGSSSSGSRSRSSSGSDNSSRFDRRK